jgi:lysophospholipase
MVSLAQVPRPAPLRALLTALSLAGLGSRLIPGGSLKPTSQKPFEGNPVTSDERRYRLAAAYADVDRRLGLGAPTVAWLREALSITGRFASPFYAEEIRQPILIIASGKDGLVSTPEVERFGRRLKGGHTVVIPEAKHEVMMERDALRAEFWGAFDAFIPGEQPFL